ncbi:hypothetical protein ILUMI_07238 [Ignelater luminosus]|uniref:Uncharacterized protein n=1 Tax=Ignelater luminosus TaxID=2038154 RepID=A0A8K0D3U3_IGNLU|nr:hypothetical protein ILUMI_07238 [Ignelater luminosus]
MYITKEKDQIVTWYNFGLSLNAVSDLFANSFPERPTPNLPTILRILSKFKRHECVNTNHHKRKRTKPARNEKIRNQLVHRIEENNRYWSRNNLYLFKESKTQYPLKVNIWAGLIDYNIIGLFFIDGNLNGEKYLELLQSQISLALNALDLDYDAESQHDGCSIGHKGEINCPPHLLDLSPNDLFYCGFLKAKVYIDKVENLEELKQRVREASQSITPLNKGVMFDMSKVQELTTKQIDEKIDSLAVNGNKVIENINQQSGNIQLSSNESFLISMSVPNLKIKVLCQPDGNNIRTVRVKSSRSRLKRISSAEESKLEEYYNLLTKDLERLAITNWPIVSFCLCNTVTAQSPKNYLFESKNTTATNILELCDQKTPHVILKAVLKVKPHHLVERHIFYFKIPSTLKNEIGTIAQKIRSKSYILFKSQTLPEDIKKLICSHFEKCLSNKH